MSTQETRQRPPAEDLHADELQRLVEHDADAQRPPGWRMTPASVVRFVAGDAGLQIAPKFVGERAFVERCVVALATNRGLMLIGRPGTAKSLPSELLAAAISGDSTLTIQGSAATTDDAIKYSWNYALLLAEGPSDAVARACAAAHGDARGTHRALRGDHALPDRGAGRAAVRPFRPACSSSPSSTPSTARSSPRQGFNLIATANTRDRGTNEMSAALKRRFNFETVLPIADIRDEMALVQRETGTDARARRHRGAARRRPDRGARDHVRRAALGQDRRRPGDRAADERDVDGRGGLGRLRRVRPGALLRPGAPAAGDVAQHLIGTAIKDEPDDVKKLRHYVEQEVRGRTGKAWKGLYAARGHLR